MLNNLAYDPFDKDFESWSMEKCGYTFYCSYNPDDDSVEVYCPVITNHSKIALARGCKYQSVASFLADEIIRENA